MSSRSVIEVSPTYLPDSLADRLRPGDFVPHPQGDKSIQQELTAHRAGLDRVERRLAAIEAKLDIEPLH